MVRTRGARRLGLLAVFFVKGAATASWASRIPDVQQRLAITEGTLGLVLVWLAVGLVVGLLGAGAIVARHGDMRITWACSIAVPVLLPLLALAPGPVALASVLLVWGMTMSIMDVAINSQAVMMEQEFGRSLVSSFHASFSLGFFAGAGVGSLALAWGLAPVGHYVAVSPLFLSMFIVGLMVFGRHERTRDTATHEELNRRPRRPSLRSRLTFPTWKTFPIGLAAFGALFVESSVNDWSGLYLRDTVQAPDTLVTAGVAAFALSMTIGRLLGDRLTMRFSPRGVVRLGGVCAAGGILVAVAFPAVVPSAIGFAFAGFGVATVVPLSFQAAGSVGGTTAATAIAGVATVGYAGFLFSPPTVGFLSEVVSLRGALALLIALSLLIVAASRRFPAAAVATTTGSGDRRRRA